MELVLAHRRVRAAYGAWSLSDKYTGPLPDTRLMDIDSAAGTQILKFGGNLKDVSYLQYELTALGYRLYGPPLPRQSARSAATTGSRALVIGTGGGRDLLSALVFGAASVDGVEINPIIVNDVMRDRFRDYSGGVYDRPERARRPSRTAGASSADRRSRYDIIQASLVDTWAATAAGAYSLSENSLYTVEAFDDYLDHLTDRGVLSMSRWVFDGLRLISLAQEAGARRGWNPGRSARDHPARQGRDLPAEEDAVHAGGDADAADAADQSRLRGPLSARHGRRRRSATAATTTRACCSRRIATRSTAQYPLDVTPTTDDRPFFFHTTRLRNHSFVAPVLRLFGVARRAPGQPGRVGDRRADRAAGAAGDLVVPDRRCSSSARWP